VGRNIRCNCAALIRNHLGESLCDATMISGHYIGVNDVNLRCLERSPRIIRGSVDDFATTASDRKQTSDFGRIAPHPVIENLPQLPLKGTR